MANGYGIRQHSHRQTVTSKDKDHTYLSLYPWYLLQNLAQSRIQCLLKE